MNTPVSILFYIKRAKVNKDGVCAIYVRVTVKSKRLEYSTNRFISPDKWSVDGAKVKGNSEEARSINKHLEFVKNDILEAHKKLYLKGIEITTKNLQYELNGVKNDIRTLIPIFQDHNTRMKELLGKEYAPGTLERYKTSLSHTKDFLLWKFNALDIDITKIDNAFVADYEFYLRSVRNCANNTAVKYIKNFHKIIRICLDNGWLEKNPFANYKSKVKEIERVYLSEEEIQNLINKDLKNDRLSLVRDIFLFSCFYGLGLCGC